MGWYVKVKARHYKLAPRMGGRNRRFTIMEPRGNPVEVPITRTRIA